MKIVYVYSAVAAKGGVERILVDKMNLLAREPDCEVYLLTYNQGTHPVSYALDKHVRHIDLDVRLHAKYRYRGLCRLWEGWKRSRWLCQRLQRTLKEIAPDVLVTATFGDLSLLLRLKGATPLVVESHGGYDHLIDYPLMNWKHRRDICTRYRLLKNADAIVSLTESDARKWRTAYPQVQVIPNVVHLNPTDQYSELAQKRILFVGRLAEQKGIPELIAAWRIIYERHPDWQLDVYGEGELARMCQSVKGLQVFSPVDDIWSKYGESSVLVLTSRWEPFGLVIPEAMSCGVPVVSFEGDGPSSIISDGKDGFLVKNRDITAFADKVCQLIEDETLLPIIYELDEEREWINEECWYKANPALGSIKSIKSLREKVERAKANPIELVNLLCKDFNIRQNTINAWLTFEDLNNEEVYSEWKDCYCIGGCDLSSTTDLTCATLLGVVNGKIRVKQMYWIPTNSLEKKVIEDKIPYDKWLKSGYLRLSGDSKVDYHDITKWFIEEVQNNDLRPLWIGYDSWNANYWKEEMSDYFDMVEVRQGFKTESAPLKQMKADLMDKKINYNNNPITKWNLSNVVVKVDDNENIMLSKEKARQRIDGAASLMDAYVIYINRQQEYLNYISEEVN